MEWNLLIQESNGKITELSKMTCKVVYTTNRTGSPGRLDITIIDPDIKLKLREGAPVRFSINGKVIFYGFIFVLSKDRWGLNSIVAYDQTRYLLTNWDYYFEGVTAGQVILRIAKQYNLAVGKIEDTGYAIPKLIQEDTSCFDVIRRTIALTKQNTGKIFIFFDDAGALSLREAQNLAMPVVIGSKSLLTEYTFKSDIDSETYNQIVLVRPNKETGIASMKLERDDKTIAQWGLLQKYERVDEQLNDAQMTQQAKTMLKYYNRALKTFQGDCVGIPELTSMRAGNMVMLNLPGTDISSSKFVLLDKVIHTYESESHTIKFETRTII